MTKRLRENHIAALLGVALMKFVFLAGSMAVALLGLAACGSMPTAPLNAAPTLTPAQRAGDPDVPFSGVITAVGPATIASQPVAKGGTLIKSAYRYRHTAQLVEDVVGFSITVPGVQAPAGAPGYYAGTFRAFGPRGAGEPSELWCFLPKVVGGKRDSICLLRGSGGVAAIAPTRMNPWLWTQFSPATGSFDFTHAPVFELRAVDIPADLQIEYRFAGWQGDRARVATFAGGREVDTTELPRQADGKFVLRTVAGTVAFSPAPGKADQAVVAIAP
ncbi:hypothetical protein [Caulobacter hibisci]|uniref:Uncharacterized protein n=1 Tax=Caulobacter hibisci TaxID=2035993 RepID=A0ABS0SZI9_9CAUL|nr:hypothetical protein [Caulobacter hibisci]MBI1685024.1 hypothetical protein [Caulobacter hibisci]